MTAEKKKTVLVVVAHADDMEFLAAGTIARFVDDLGYDVYEYILTDNSKGSYRLTSEELIQVSAEEARAAGAILGLKEVRLEGYVDGNLGDTPINELRGKIMSMIREVKADIVMSWDPFAPYEEHPDHRQTAMATLEAAHFSGNPLFYPEHNHAPYQTTEMYWFAKSPMNAELFVDITSTIEKKIQALLAHECQMELTVDALACEAEVLGIDMPMLSSPDAEARAQLIEMGIRNYFGELGEKTGVAYAEQFRYERVGMLEKILGLPARGSDFS
jgi:LmbE family N-acetylglucosaminyl deacetylase